MGNVKITIIICITLLILTGIVTYGIVINELAETPYEQCLKSCNLSDKITCTKICTEEFKEAIEILVNKLSPLISEYFRISQNR